MAENNSILHELYVFSEWKPEPEYLQKPDNILPENISSLWRWLKFFGPKKSLIDSVAAHKERKQKWHIALGDEGKVIGVLTDNILEIRTKRSEYATIAARTTVARDAYTQWRKLVWSPDCSFIVVAYGNGVVSFFDLTASNLFNIPVDCSRPGGLECTDNTHAVSEIIFLPLRVKDTKWNWEVLVVTYDGKLRGYLVSQTDGYKLHHTFQFPGGVSAAAYCEPHSTLYIAGVPRVPYKEPSSPVSAGITAWRVLNDEPFYKLSVVSDELEAQLANKRFHLYIPLIFPKNMDFIIHMAASPDHSKLVCIHCNGDISIWRLPILKGECRFRLAEQPEHDLQSPLNPDQGNKDQSLYQPAGVSWWSNEEVILSRFSGAVSVCRVKDLVNILGKKPEFFQGTPQISSAYDGTFMALECESNVLPARKSRSDESMEVVEADAEMEDSMLEITKELFKSILYAITDIETFQPKPKKITIVSRIYRLLGVKSTTPSELFSRKIESGSYKEALSLAERFALDSDLVYQQQWRKNPVSSDAIHNYLSKVSKKIWAVHQCVDRLPESLPAAHELLSFGLQLTNEKILDEINGNLPPDEWKDPDDITMEDLNAYTSELLRCRHVMIFYKERLSLYEAILHCEKSTYVKDEYHRLRSNSIVHSAMEIAKEGRIEALTCLWPYIKSLTMQLAVLDKLPETLYPLDYQHLLPTKEPVKWFEKKSPIKIKPSEYENDWCRKEIFRSIWSSNWSEDAPTDSQQTSSEDEESEVEEAGGDESEPEEGATSGVVTVIPESLSETDAQLAGWYARRARRVEQRSGLVSHALTLVMIAAAGGAVPGLHAVQSRLETLDTLLYDVNVEDVTLRELEAMSNLEVCKLLMKMSTHATFVSDLKKYVIPFLKRHEDLTKTMGSCLSGLKEFLETLSIKDLSYILLVLQSPKEFELDVRTHLELVERCLYAHIGTDQLDMACDLLATILKETDGSISTASLVRRAGALERTVAGSGRLAWRGVRVSPSELRRRAHDADHAHALMHRVARSLPHTLAGDQKPTQQDWEHLLKDMLELRTTLFDCITEEKCYEMYVSSLLTSGDAPSIRLAADVLSVSADARPVPNGQYRVDYARSVELVSNASKEYFNSASSLTDPALELARCCLLLIQDNNVEIEKELDLIAALPILSAFNVTMLPIQVRLCEDRMRLIEECLTAEPNAYLASHKLLKLAKLLRIAGNDEQTREGMILTCIGQHALSAGAAGGAAASSAAHRLAALRHAPAAALLARVAAHAHAHADTAERRALLAAAAALAPANVLNDVLKARLRLELESMQQMGVALKDNNPQVERWPSTEEEFADAITTPVIEKKDLVPSSQTEKPMPILNYLLDTFQNKFTLSEKSKAAGAGGGSGGGERAVHCQEFYRSLYSHAASGAHYSYGQFSAADAPGAAAAATHQLLVCFYTTACLDGAVEGMEEEVIKKCSDDLLYKDTALSVAIMLRSSGAGGVAVTAGDARVALAAALYAALLRCNASVLRDHAYLAEPQNMAYMTLKRNNATGEQMTLICQYLDKLNGMGEVDRMRRLGLSVNSLLFNADTDYRTEVIYRLARTGGAEQARISVALAEKYELDAVDVWLQYAGVALPTVELHTIPVAAYVEEAWKRIRDALWPPIRGNDYPSLISFFAILKKIDDKIQMHGLNVGEHLRLLKKAKAASPDLDYKLLVTGAPPSQLTRHVLGVMRPDNAGMVCKLLRTLPPALAPVPLPALYTKWLTGYFFSVAATGASKKWMQRWRQCVGFFTKLSKDEIMEFVAAVCFSKEALERVPSGTRNLIILQAMDYCQQEQGNDFKFAKNEQTWGQMGQELGRWGRFLENYHSSSVQVILDASEVPKDVWFELEMSHGGVEGVTASLARAAVCGLRAPALASLLQCLRVPADAHHVLQRALHHVHTAEEIEMLVTRITQYHKDGVKLNEEFLDAVMQKATELGLPPHKQLGLLSLSQRARVQDGEDLLKVSQFTVDLFKTEWPESEYAQQLTEAKIVDPEGRREALRTLTPLANTWQRRKALADALACWPPTHGEDGRSLHCEYLEHALAQGGQRADNLVLVKMLLRRPILTEQEVKLLAESARNDIVNTIWVILLNPCDSSHEILRNLLIKYKELVQKLRIEEEMIKEILDQGMFIKLVSTPIYSNIIYYILNSKALGQGRITYTVHWAIAELIKANYLAEAGHLQLLALGTTTSLLGFSESVLYCLDMMK